MTTPPLALPQLRVVAGVLIQHGRVLAALRPAHKSQGGLWELPGGKVEGSESEAQALVRELREELGVQVAVHEQLGLSVHRYLDKTVRLIALRCTLVRGTPRAIEHQALSWLTADQLDSMIWAPADRPLLSAVALCLT